ncbi:MAG: hypothetical protein ACK40X_12390, partial [Armatimonadota bacterium]
VLEDIEQKLLTDGNGYRRVADYQQLRIRCPRCERLNLATDTGCRYCGTDLLKADFIRGSDYDRFDPNDLRKSCLLAIVPGLGLLRERKVISGLAMLFAGACLFIAFWLDWVQGELAALSIFLIVALSIASVFITFLVALDRMGIPRPSRREQLILLGRLVAGYLLLVIALLTRLLLPVSALCSLLPVLVLAVYLTWRLLQPFF